MSAQPSGTPDRPAQLNQRSQSQQNNTLAIRIVPYTPPRIVSGESARSQASSHAYAAEDSSGSHGDQLSTGEDSARTGRGGEGRERRTSSQGLALSFTSANPMRLAGSRGDEVSGTKPSSPTPVGGPRQPPARPPSEVTNITSINAPSPAASYSALDQTELPSPTSVSTAAYPRPLSRNRNHVAVNSDGKTFTLVRRGPSSLPSESRSLISPPLSYSSRTSATSSHERPSVDAWSEDRSSPPLTGGTSATILDRSPYTTSPSSSTTQLVADPITSSPWNYRMVGGLRKVPQTPDLKQIPRHREPSSAPESPLPPLPEISVTPDAESPTHSVIPKASFASDETSSSVFETTNYDIYGHDSSQGQVSSDSLAPPSSSHSNYVLLGESSPAPPFNSSPPGTSDDDDNYVLHGDPSPSPSAIVPTKPRPTYSQESLKVAPLRPARKTSYERLGYLQQRSRENLRARAGSIKSIKSFSSIISEQAVQAFFAAPVLLDIPGLSSSQTTASGGSSRQAQDSWAALQTAAGPSSRSPTNIAQQRVQMLPSTPHQWSSQLSTVMSESEGSSRAGSRSASLSSAGNNNNSGGGHVRRSSAGWASSMHSRQLPSISSSLAAQLEENEGLSSLSVSRSASLASLDRPQPTYTRSGGSHVRMIRDQDEHGDGLTDLEAISSKPSKSGLSGFFSSTDSSRNLHSSGSSSRANSLTGSLPAWARVYYGSGERRFLGSASIAESDHSRPGSSAVHGSASPNTDHYPLNIYSARRRANQVNPPMEQRPFSDSADMDINVIPPQDQDYHFFWSLKRKTSSIWSPHLRTDRRASRYSVWEPPSVPWTDDSGMLGRRNAQVVLFIAGFLFPFGEWLLCDTV
jgi:hypothetical protein